MQNAFHAFIALSVLASHQRRWVVYGLISLNALNGINASLTGSKRNTSYRSVTGGAARPLVAREKLDHLRFESIQTETVQAR
jgi:hypothetical protein